MYCVSQKSPPLHPHAFTPPVSIGKFRGWILAIFWIERDGTRSRHMASEAIDIKTA
ncbi:uncharacterized protein PgNI_03363 [Pyricularia grisea]|uniref:Uncharacterized protein n=1 Tax=Pyricularia grisea TaxID=148305 RepID=A0A6P8BCZ3_PYRGI|nr:uncharacterized protein PgNI_03363 [Pyricularia grisea]TLD13683.1 hypothetical protein PgNI_03363 [Pyricularia grisea]